MACHAVRMWSLTGLVGAFLDLTIAYFLLCASAVAYLASKFLGFFGLNLPCPCDVAFIRVHSRNLCFERLLVDFPIKKLLHVQLSVRQKFPFSNSVSPQKFDCSIVGDSCDNRVLELEGEESCGSSRGSVDLVRLELNSRIGKIDIKGKGVLSHRPHRKRAIFHRKSSSLLSYDPPLHEKVIDEQPYNHFITSKSENRFGDGSLPVDTAGNSNLEYDNAPTKMLSGEELQDKQQGVEDCDGDLNNKIKLLEKTLENERVAQAALYVELEKERSAAASAADEAMAMILRLQEEKAAIEMEGRQYQRIIEEKSAYDDEEMNILEEILVRREKETLSLQKEVEAYRQMVSGGVKLSFEPHSEESNEISVDSGFGKMDIEKEIVSEDKEIQLTPKAMNNGNKNKLTEKVIRTCDSADNEHHVYDVHIIGDDINREASVPLPPIRRRCSSQGLQRSSISAVDNEMLKIDTEIDQLRERLKLVQEGKGKLGFSLENRESKNAQLKILEGISLEIQEIRQASSPLPKSKGLSKKRRSRSVSSE